MLFLTPKQHCQSTEGQRTAGTKSLKMISPPLNIGIARRSPEEMTFPCGMHQQLKV